MFGFMVVKFTRPAGGVAVRMFGKTGAPAWVGERLMLNWLVLVMAVVLPLESRALARARSGMRS